MNAGVNRRVLPGFRISIAYVILYLSLLVLIPLAACLAKAASLTPREFLAAVWTPRAQAAYALSFGAALVAAIANVGIGTIVSWTLVRYRFPGRRIVDALVDIPLALPTAVAGLVYASLYVPDGWLGQFLTPLGIKAAYSRLGIVLVLVFTGFPFVVRAVQPVLEDLDAEMEEAAAVLGASRWQTFLRVIMPTLVPPALTGFALAFARGLGEYGSVVFISSNKMFETEIAPMLILVRLEEFSYAEAAAIATVLLGFSFLMLAAINYLEWRSKRYGT
jgi:sulfate/thiosulfate transport system permease protein